MKKIILFSIGITVSVIAFCQSSKIEYDGGTKAFSRLLAKKIYAPEEMYIKDTSSTYSVVMNIDKNGLIDRIEITSFGDSTGTRIIVEVLKLTQSKWINHSGQDQLVSFQVYFIPGEESTQNTPAVDTRNYMSWRPKPVINLGPIICRYYKPVS